MTLQEYLRIARDNDVRHLDKMPHPAVEAASSPFGEAVKRSLFIRHSIKVDSWKMLPTIMTEHGPKPLLFADMSWLRQAIATSRSLFLNGS